MPVEISLLRIISIACTLYFRKERNSSSGARGDIWIESRMIPELLDRVKKFIGQEGIHHKEHEKFWDILEDMNLKPQRFARFYNYTAYNFPEKGLFRLLGNKRGAHLALSLTSALEHFTALLGDGGLRHDPFSGLTKEVRLLLHWHAAEELEHKSVCFDLYNKVGGDYPTRVAGMVLASIFLWLYIGAGQMYFVAMDDQKDWSKLPEQYYTFLKSWLSNEGMTNIRKCIWIITRRIFIRMTMITITWPGNSLKNTKSTLRKWA